MHRTAVINVVGLSSGLIGDHLPLISSWLREHNYNHIRPQLPAVTCTMQSTYLTGKGPETHGIVGNGWYFKDECEVKFWRQSNKLVQSPKIWDAARRENPSFTCANLFWWYNMYSSVDFSVTPRPNYLADGRKIPDVYSYPSSLRDQLQSKLGSFPLFNFWGPATSIASSEWIADAAKYTENLHRPTLTLVYLPHLDYCLQKYHYPDPRTVLDLMQIDKLCGELIDFYQSRGVKVILLSEYGISPVNNPISINRLFRQQGWLAVREEQGLELLDPGASLAFGVADHQVAHIYVQDPNMIKEVRQLLEQESGVGAVLDKEQQSHYKLNHQRSGDLVALAREDSWFTYYYWMEDQKAPDFARTVDIHRKPGYDPLEMFLDPELAAAKLQVGWKLIKKKLGLRTLMDVIPLDPSLISGSHGIIPSTETYWPVIGAPPLTEKKTLEATEVYQVIWNTLFYD